MKTSEDARKRILTDLVDWVEALKAAVDELNGEREPEKPADLVRRIRGARKEIRALLDEAEAYGMEDQPLVRRLRAAHPS